ncbi:MAG: hypothetical protein ACOCUU_02300 [Nanoarchaeota archaeon]
MLTIKEAADYADKSESWVRQKILSGEISAQKNKFKYGKRWETTKQNIDDFLEQAKIEKDIVEVREIKNPISKEEFLKEISKNIEKQKEQLLEDTKDLITYKEQKVSEALKEQNKSFLNEMRDEVNEFFKSNNELILELKKEREEHRKEHEKILKEQKKLLMELKKEREEKRNKNGFLSKIKKFLFN